MYEYAEFIWSRINNTDEEQMHVYEKGIRDRINRIAGEDIWFRVSDIMEMPEPITDTIICELLGNACSATNIMPITIGRVCLHAFPADWISEKIKKLVFSAIDINDDHDYRRFLELSEMISEDLLIWAVPLGENSENPDIAEAYNDYKLGFLLDSFNKNKTLTPNEVSELISMINKDAEYVDWENTIDHSLNAEIIDRYLFDYFYKNDICLERLAHMELSDKHLKKLSADYEEAFITLAVRYFVSDDYSVSELMKLLKDCRFKSVFEKLYFISDNLTEKTTAVNYAVSRNKYLTSEDKDCLHKLYYSKILLFSDDEKALISAFEENEPVYMLSLSRNINTPEYILNKLVNISRIKYASKIRNNSRETLKYKKQADLT